MRNRACFLGVAVLVAVTSAFSNGAEPIFVPVKIDGPVHDPANHTYWFGPFSECCSVLDVDGEGDLDIAAGRNWHEAPDWMKHENFLDGADFVKTPTGFAADSAPIEDLKLMRENVSDGVQVKTAGRVRTPDMAPEVGEAAATRFGATKTADTLEECYRRKGTE